MNEDEPVRVFRNVRAAADVDRFSSSKQHQEGRHNVLDTRTSVRTGEPDQRGQIVGGKSNSDRRNDGQSWEKKPVDGNAGSGREKRLGSKRMSRFYEIGLLGTQFCQH